MVLPVPNPLPPKSGVQLLSGASSSLRGQTPAGWSFLTATAKLHLMTSRNDTFLGFDPGGKNGYGVAMLVGREVTTNTVSTVADALSWAVSQCGTSVPAATGVDTLLHWCDEPCGWRPADRWLWTTYPKSALSIAAANSLYRAIGVRGMALAVRRWNDGLLSG
jgi:hypothetical protein